MEQSYEVIIVGGGPAGLSAAIYACRSKLKTLVIEKICLGGQILIADLIENYPGFPEGISGFDLGQLIADQAMKYQPVVLDDEALGVEISGQDKMVRTTSWEYSARALIIASGTRFSTLGVPGEELVGKGVSYCATCDGPLFQEQEIAVVGGGNAAISEALYLTKFATKVFVIHRRDQLRATKLLQERALANPKIEFLWNTVVDSITGDNRVQGLNLRNVATGAGSSLNVAGVFVAVGRQANTEYLDGVLTLLDDGSIPVDSKMGTSLPGVFAAGDLRQNSPRQVAAAVGDGAIAAISAERFLSG